MDAQDFRSLQEAYMDVYGELDEGRGDDLRTKYGLKPGEVSARLSNRAERKALNIGGRTHFERQKRDPLLRLSGSSRSRSRGETPTDPRRNSQGQLRDIRSRGGRPSNVYDSGANRDRGDKGERLAKFVSGKRNNPNMTDSERRTAHHNREEYDLYDIILSHLLDEGYAETQKAAETIMVNMSEEWRESIVEGIGTKLAAAGLAGIMGAGMMNAQNSVIAKRQYPGGPLERDKTELVSKKPADKAKKDAEEKRQSELYMKGRLERDRELGIKYK